jgi:hypothetical protein
MSHHRTLPREEGGINFQWSTYALELETQSSSSTFKSKEINVFLLTHWSCSLRFYFCLFLVCSASKLQSSVPQHLGRRTRYYFQPTAGPDCCKMP